MTSVRCVLVVATARNLPLYQLDVHNVFLHGVLDKEVYMKLLPGFYQSEKSQGKVCRVIKSLYGLRQASRQWFAQFSNTLTELGFQQSMNDYSVFTMVRGSNFIVLLV